MMKSARNGKPASIDVLTSRGPLIASVFASAALLALTAAMAAPQHHLVILLLAAFVAMSGTTFCLAGRVGAELATAFARDDAEHPTALAEMHGHGGVAANCKGRR